MCIYVVCHVTCSITTWGVAIDVPKEQRNMERKVGMGKRENRERRM